MLVLSRHFFYIISQLSKIHGFMSGHDSYLHKHIGTYLHEYTMNNESGFVSKDMINHNSLENTLKALDYDT